jgi:hypothetical protein
MCGFPNYVTTQTGLYLKKDVLYNVVIGAVDPPAHTHTHTHTHTHRTQIKTCVYTPDLVNHSKEHSPLVKLTVAQLVKLLSFYGTRGSTIVFTTAC